MDCVLSIGINSKCALDIIVEFYGATENPSGFQNYIFLENLKKGTTMDMVALANWQTKIVFWNMMLRRIN